MQGAKYLTARQLDLLALLASGHTPKEIAEIEYMSEHTVRNYLKNAKKRAEANSHIQTVVYAIKVGRLVIDDEGIVSKSKEKNV